MEQDETGAISAPMSRVAPEFNKMGLEQALGSVPTVLARARGGQHFASGELNNVRFMLWVLCDARAERLGAMPNDMFIRFSAHA